jgi:hypothetical protein
MSTKKAMVRISLLLTFLIAAVGSVAVMSYIQNDVFLTTSSPKGTYTVHLSGQRDWPKVPFRLNNVFFSVVKDGKKALTNKYLHSGDWLDPSFDHAYPLHNWIRDDVLHFYRKEVLNEAGQERIVIQNRTNTAVQYLLVTSVESFLLFDVQPGAVITLAVPPVPADLRWISAEGEFVEDRKIKRTGADFMLRSGAGGPFVYYVYIDEDGLKIESPNLQKYKPYL